MVLAKRKRIKKKKRKSERRKKEMVRFGKLYLTPKEIRRIIKLLLKKNIRANKRKNIKEWIDYVLFSNHTGVRIKEYCHLKWENIDLDSGKGDIKRSYTKTKAGVRPIYITDEKLLQVLKEKKAKYKLTDRISDVWERQW